VPIATTDEQRAIADSVRGWASKAEPLATVRAQETAGDGWRKHWADLADLGLFAVSVPEGVGGGGGTVADLAVMLEAAAAELVPGPIASTALAGLLLSKSSAPTAGGLVARVAAGSLTFGVALELGTVIGTRRADGGLTVRGSITPVLGADQRSGLVLAARVDDEDVWFVLDPDLPTVKLVERDGADFSRPIAEVHLDETVVAAERVLAGITTALVRDLAATLFAAEAAGVAGWCLRTAVEYAKVREQFGKPIGSFQAIKHLCAEMLCRVELATAVAWDAAQAADDADQAPIAASVAAAVALDAAVETAKDCIQVLGGIGFTWEHDAHLYLRRALALRQLLGGNVSWRRRTAELTLQGSRRELHIDVDGCAGGERVAVRERVGQIAALPSAERRQALVDAGYLAPHWPKPYGLGAGAVEQLVIDQELAHAGVARPDLVIAGWAVPTILQFGTPEQIDRFVLPTLRGELIWCQLFSEPGAGSDLAGLRTKAQRVEAGWRLTGQKVWTSVAQQADWGISLARTDPEAQKHHGISYFLVDMTSAGLDVRPLREITGEAVFNEVFLGGVFVPDSMLVGEENNGWKLARATLANERIAMGGGSSMGDAVEHLVVLAVELGLTDDDAVSERIGALISEGLAGSLLDLRSTLRQIGGMDAASESSVRKLVGVRHRQAVAETGLELLGPLGALDTPQLQNFLLSRCLTIAGGTTQVLLTLAGERLLGLPRDK
jgi:alkylation response protein AidB-like acyl-CoA dehydrogenase